MMICAVMGSKGVSFRSWVGGGVVQASSAAAGTTMPTVGAAFSRGEQEDPPVTPPHPSCHAQDSTWGVCRFVA